MPLEADRPLIKIIYAVILLIIAVIILIWIRSDSNQSSNSIHNLQCRHFYIFGRKNCSSSLQEDKLDVGHPPNHHVGNIPVIQFGDGPAGESTTWPSTNLSEKIYVSLTLNPNLSLLGIPGFSLVGRVIDSRLIGELWISVPSSQILEGFNQLPLKGIKTRCRG